LHSFVCNRRDYNRIALAEHTEGRSLQVLLVEDNAGDIYLLERALEKAAFRHTLTILRDGAEAMAFLSRTEPADDYPPDLILLDLNLPKVDGSTILELFRTRPTLENTPVVLLSSSQAPYDINRARGLKRCIYLTKPSSLEAFLNIGQQVKTFWDQWQHEPSAASPAQGPAPSI
jgi:two-component system, chemotaxis family, response regulator Rcp1